MPAGSIRPDTSSQSQAHNESSPAASSDMQIKGTVHLVNVEGGCWRLDAANGSHYEIYKGSAPAGLLEDGRQVTATVKLRPDLMSICMVGPIIEVISVEG
ncbi:MAG: hypothetical protein ABI613_03615 [Gemmatimonadota bacterium]